METAEGLCAKRTHALHESFIGLRPRAKSQEQQTGAIGALCETHREMRTLKLRQPSEPRTKRLHRFRRHIARRAQPQIVAHFRELTSKRCQFIGHEDFFATAARIEHHVHCACAFERHGKSHARHACVQYSFASPVTQALFAIEHGQIFDVVKRHRERREELLVILHRLARLIRSERHDQTRIGEKGIERVGGLLAALGTQEGLIQGPRIAIALERLLNLMGQPKEARIRRVVSEGLERCGSKSLHRFWALRRRQGRSHMRQQNEFDPSAKIFGRFADLATTHSISNCAFAVRPEIALAQSADKLTDQASHLFRFHGSYLAASVAANALSSRAGLVRLAL